ncbi:NAD-dependent epimerase/dehydratase family protein [Paenibacillus terrigena]|uniref:polysaccharide biosynthesis C-terminal domain-containing protein n=1 Tax=Paenibacillus terrigena TaxID=369333 RepID=UPI00037163B8|nr:NAD-dependent epimerase/dehydratase family protein [Paenibacillus terrigena]
MKQRAILITGAYGFIGKNLAVALEQREDCEIMRIGSKNSYETLEEYVLKADFIYHLAGVNRPDYVDEFLVGNRDLTDMIIQILIENNKRTPLLLTSSLQAEMDNPYGNSKRAAEEIVLNYRSLQLAPVYIYRLPNVFGKWCKPNYNSVIATWANNIAHDLAIDIHEPSKEINLVYIDDVVQSFSDHLTDKEYTQGTHYNITKSFNVSLSRIAEQLHQFKKSRTSLQSVEVSDDFTRCLYSTYLSYLSPDNFSYHLNKNSDNRGWLSEFMKSDKFGQIFISRTKPGITRGNHWHHTKVEKFLVVEGQAVIKFRGIEDHTVLEYVVSGNDPEVVDIPPGYTHSITNIGDTELVTLFWANEVFDKSRPDTYYLEV